MMVKSKIIFGHDMVDSLIKVFLLFVVKTCLEEEIESAPSPGLSLPSQQEQNPYSRTSPRPVQTDQSEIRQIRQPRQQLAPTVGFSDTPTRF